MDNQPDSQYSDPDNQHGAPPEKYDASTVQYNAPSEQYNAPPVQYGASPGYYRTPPVQYGAPPGYYRTPPVQPGAPTEKYDASTAQYNAPPVQYGAPHVQYNAPPVQYGAPPMQYGAPPVQYGAPPGQYGYPAGQYYYQLKPYSIPRKIWRILYPALIFLAVQVVTTFAASLIAGLSYIFRELMTGQTALDETAVMDVVLQYISNNLMLIVLISNIVNFFVFMPMWRATRKHLEPRRDNNIIVTAILTTCFFAGFNIIQMFLFSVTDVIKFFPSYEDAAIIIAGDHFIVQLIAIGVAAPVVEELIFRGVIMGRMTWLPVWAAVLIQAALFGIAHMNLFQGLYAFIAGIMLALLYVKYRSLTLAIIGHMAFNLASVLLGEFLEEDAVLAALLVVAVSFVAAVLCAVLLIRRQGAAVIREPEMQQL